MIPIDDKSILLNGFLGNLPEMAAGKLAHAVEMDRLMDGHELPHMLRRGDWRLTLCPSRALDQAA